MFSVCLSPFPSNSPVRMQALRQELGLFSSQLYSYQEHFPICNRPSGNNGWTGCTIMASFLILCIHYHCLTHNQEIKSLMFQSSTIHTEWILSWPFKDHNMYHCLSQFKSTYNNKNVSTLLRGTVWHSSRGRHALWYDRLPPTEKQLVQTNVYGNENFKKPNVKTFFKI